jgi:ferric-dicitrate binding protein FerR (iron transport regulator)
VGTAFDSLTREVTLEGEAYFDVIHDARRPFVVHVRNAVVRDVGTRFSIRAYPGDSAVRVLVTQGNVRLGRSLKGDSADALLGRGMLARIDAAGATTIRTRVDTLRYVSWTSGVLTFTSTPLREVVTELGRWYDVEFQLADSALGARRISANIGNQPLPRLLDQLAVMLDVHVSRGGRRITLTRAGGAVH